MDLLSTRTSNNEVELSANRKETNSNIYNDWYSHAPSHWKFGTLNLIKWVKFIRSSQHLKNEVNYTNNIFTEYNDYSFNVSSNTIDQDFSQETAETKNKHILQNIQLMVPYSGQQGHQLLSKMKN